MTNPVKFIVVLSLFGHGGALAHSGHPGHIAILDEERGQSASLAIRLDQLAQAKDSKSANKLAADISAAWLDLGGDAVDLLMDRGVGAFGKNDLALARDMFDRIVLIKPDYAEVWYQRALVFAKKKQLIETVRDLEEALKHEPRHFLAWQALGEILETMGERTAALHAYRRAVALHPFSAGAIRGRDRLIPLVEGSAL